MLLVASQEPSDVPKDIRQGHFARVKQNNGGRLRPGKRNSLCEKSVSASFRSVALDK